MVIFFFLFLFLLQLIITTDRESSNSTEMLLNLLPSFLREIQTHCTYCLKVPLRSYEIVQVNILGRPHRKHQCLLC